MGGSGKTTLARHLYDSNRRKYKCACFMERIAQKCEKPDGLLTLQKQLLKYISRADEIYISNVFEAKYRIQQILEKEKVFIVLDDISKPDQLEELLGYGEINPQSRIIITTRIKDVAKWPKIKGWSCWELPMKLLDDEESKELLSQYVLRSTLCTEGFKELAKDAVEYCGGNPLALQVMGSSLREGNTIQHWRSHLKGAKKEIDERVRSVLLSSYESLPMENVKQLFLHIACFFVGEDKEEVVQILEPDYCAVSGIQTLINKCLVYVLPNKKLMMHPLLQQTGKFIVHQESPKLPEKRSRVWLSNDSYTILSQNKASETIEGLALDMRMMDDKAFKPKELKTDTLQKMENLKLLQLKYVDFSASTSYNYFSDLRWLCWVGFQVMELSSDFYMGNLVALDMSHGRLLNFRPPTLLHSLQFLNLTRSYKLSKIHDLYLIPKLKSLILWDCGLLVYVCESIGKLKELEILNMTGCTCFSIMQERNSLKWPVSLQTLYLSNSFHDLKSSLPLSFEHPMCLHYLNLGGNEFSHLPSLHHLNELRVLDLSCCDRLRELLDLPSILVELYVYHCEFLKKITFQSHQFKLQEFGYYGCRNLSEIEGFFKLVPIFKLNEIDLEHMYWPKAYENHDVCLVRDDELTIGIWPGLKMLYEFNIMSTSLTDIKDPNLIPDYTSESTSLSFIVPPPPENMRLKGLNISFKYKTSGDNWIWFAKISTINGVDVVVMMKLVYG